MATRSGGKAAPLTPPTEGTVTPDPVVADPPPPPVEQPNLAVPEPAVPVAPAVVVEPAPVAPVVPPTPVVQSTPTADDQQVDLQRRVEQLTAERDQYRQQRDDARQALTEVHAAYADQVAPHPDEARLVTPTVPNTGQSAVLDSPVETVPEEPGGPRHVPLL